MNMSLTEISELIKLADTNREKFEQKRLSIINRFIDALSTPSREKAVQFQRQLDEKRLAMSSEEFTSHCISEMEENYKRIDNLIDKALSLKLNVPIEKIATIDGVLK